MASVIRIKRSSVSGNPTTLAAGELAYSALPDTGSNGGDRLYVGIGTETSGNAANHVVIGGKYFTDAITAATNTNTASTLIKRDASGNFSAGTITATLTGNASSATKLATGRTLALTGDVAYTSPSFDGSADVTATATLSNTTVTAGTYGSSTQLVTFTVDSKGRITAAANTALDASIVITTANQTLTNKTMSANSIWNGTTIGVAYGGTGSTNGSITGTDSLTFTAGGTNTNVTLSPNGTGTVDVSSKRITSVADPSGAQDAATKSYVDATKSGLDIKASVRLATAVNLTATASGTGVGKTLTNSGVQAPLTIDSIPTVVGDRILVKDQTLSQNNGIYTVTSIGSASTNWVLTRSTDADNTPTGEVNSGMFAFVTEGTVNADNAFVLTTNNPIVLDTTGLTFTQFSGAGQIIAGTGLTKTGNTLDVQVGTGIEIVSDTVTLATTVAGAGLAFTSGVLSIGGTTDRISIAADSIDISSAYVGQSTITTLGTIATGVWNGTTLATGYGGTGLTTYSVGDLIYASATNVLSKLSGGADGKVLQMNAAGVPVWLDVDGGTY